MWDLKKNYKKEEEQPLCPLCEIEEDTTEHVLRCGRDIDRKQRTSKIIRKKNGMKQYRYVEKTKEKEKKEERKFRKEV